MYYIKTLNPGATSRHGFFIGNQKAWDKPQQERPGAWAPPVSGELSPHFWGYHLSRIEHLVLWFAAENYVAEASPETKQSGDCLVARSARLIRKIDIPPPVFLDLAFTWALPATTIPDVFPYPFEYGRALQDMTKILHASWKSGAKEVCRPERDGKYEATRTALKLLIKRCESDRCNTLEYRLHCQSVLHAGYAVRALAKVTGRTQPWRIAKEIAFHTATATSLALEIGNNVCVPAPADSQHPLVDHMPTIRARQNDQFIKAILPGNPWLKDYFPSL